MIPTRSHMTEPRPTSAVLDDLLGDAPAEPVTLDGLMARRGDHSFGVALLLLALLGLLGRTAREAAADVPPERGALP